MPITCCTYISTQESLLTGDSFNTFWQIAVPTAAHNTIYVRCTFIETIVILALPTAVQIRVCTRSKLYQYCELQKAVGKCQTVN
jgi:hypothetical protein